MYFQTLNEMFNSDAYEFEKDPKSTSMDVIFYFKEDDGGAVYKVHFEKQVNLGKKIFRVMLGQKGPGLKFFKKVMAGKFHNALRVIATIIKIHQAFDEEGIPHTGYAIGIPTDHFGNYVSMFKSVVSRKMRGYVFADYDAQPPKAAEDGLSYFYMTKKPYSFEQAFDGKWIKDAAATIPAKTPLEGKPAPAEVDVEQGARKEAMDMVSGSVSAAFDQWAEWGGLKNSIDNYFDNLRDTLKDNKTPAHIVSQAEEEFHQQVEKMKKSPPAWYKGPSTDETSQVAWYSDRDKYVYVAIPRGFGSDRYVLMSISTNGNPAIEATVARAIGKTVDALHDSKFKLISSNFSRNEIQDRIDVRYVAKATPGSPFILKVPSQPAPKTQPQVAPSIAHAIQPTKTIAKVDDQTLKDALNELKYMIRTQVKGGASTWLKWDPIEEQRNGWMIAVRDLGTWEGDDGSGDYDFQTLSDKTYKEIEAVVSKVSAKFPAVDINFSTGEKNWIYFDASPKK